MLEIFYNLVSQPFIQVTQYIVHTYMFIEWIDM
jgi:hypothetical protein